MLYDELHEALSPRLAGLPFIVMGHLHVITTGAPNQFQPVQRALAGQRLLQIAPSAEQRQQRIAAQLLMVVEVFIAQRQSIDALRLHLRQRVLDQRARAAVGKTLAQTSRRRGSD
jgi:hypothetical protein